MAHTAVTRTHTQVPESWFKTIGQISLADGDVTTALAAATRTNWVVITNSDGSLRHVVPTSELTRI